MSDLARLYQEIILEHHRAPRRAGRLSAPTHAADGHNPLCGDRVGVTLEVAGGRVVDAGCEVRGCAICRASGSLMAETVVGRELGELRAFSARFLAALAAEPSAAATGAGSSDPAAAAGADGGDAAGFGPLEALLEARRFPNRRRCASLSWEVLERALTSS